VSVTSSAKRREIVVVGGGLAGLSAALDLCSGGLGVTVLEARPTLGGAVQTLPRRDGDPNPPPDNGQHIALGCFTEYARFLERIGQAGSLRRMRLSLPVLDEQSRTATIGAGPPGLMRYKHLTLRERASAVAATARLSRLDSWRHDEESFGDVLRRFGQSERVIERLWDVFMRPALNLASDEASASLGIFTVQTALLGSRADSDVLLPAAPLSSMHGEAAGLALERAGARIRTSSRVSELGDGTVMLATGEVHACDGIVIALPAAESAELLGETAPALEDSPIVSVHMLFDRELLGEPMAALLDSDAHWVFDRGQLTGHVPEQGQYLTVVSSGVPELTDTRGQEVVDVMAEQLTSRLGPAELVWSRLSREPRATFAGRPGSGSERRGARTSRPGVVRAGAWTATGWPATMEGAVRSGQVAARELLRANDAT